MKIYLLLVLIFMICFVGAAQTVDACDGGGNKISEKQLNRATLIFSGKVIALEWRKDIFIKSADDVAKRSGGTYEVLAAKFEVDKWWKGAPGKTVSVMYGPIRFSKEHFLRGSCDYRFYPGETYLVYADGEENKYGTDTPAGTKPLIMTADDLKILGEGKDPIEEKKAAKPQ